MFSQVSDYGERLDLQEEEHIFEPFVTAKPEGIEAESSSTRPLQRSTGGRLSAESGPRGHFRDLLCRHSSHGVS
jgi:signal transduction histidine kinase